MCVCTLAVFECMFAVLNRKVQSELLQCKQNECGFGFRLRLRLLLKTLFPQSNTFDCYCTKGRVVNLGASVREGGGQMKGKQRKERLHYQERNRKKIVIWNIKVSWWSAFAI